MPTWLWPVLGFALAFLVLAGYFRHVAGGKVEHHAMLDWGLIIVAALAAVALWGHFHDGKPLSNPLEQIDVCSQTGQVGGPPIQSAPCGVGHTSPVIDAAHNDPLARPMSATLPNWMSSEMAQDRYNQCMDDPYIRPTAADCARSEALYQCLKAGGSMASCGG